MMVSNSYYCVQWATHLVYTNTCAQNAQLNGIYVPTVHCTELEINFQKSDYVVNEGDQQISIILQLKKVHVQNSFNMTLYPVSITEARDPAGRFNVSAFIASVSADAEAMPGKGVIFSEKYL